MSGSVCASVVCVSTTNTHTHTERGETGTVTVTKRRQAAGSAKRRLSRVARGRLICLNKLCTWITNNSGQRCCLAAETTTHTHTHTHVHATPPPCLVWVSLALGRVINVSVVVAKCFSIQIWFYLPTLFLPGGRCRPPFPPPSQCLPSLPACPVPGWQTGYAWPGAPGWVSLAPMRVAQAKANADC